MDREYQAAGLKGPVECYPKNGDCVIVNCVLCRIAQLEAVFDAAWALHHTAREQGGSLTVVGTAEYVDLCKAMAKALGEGE